MKYILDDGTVLDDVPDLTSEDLRQILEEQYKRVFGCDTENDGIIKSLIA